MFCFFFLFSLSLQIVYTVYFFELLFPSNFFWVNTYELYEVFTEVALLGLVVQTFQLKLSRGLSFELLRRVLALVRFPNKSIWKDIARNYTVLLSFFCIYVFCLFDHLFYLLIQQNISLCLLLLLINMDEEYYLYWSFHHYLSRLFFHWMLIIGMFFLIVQDLHDINKENACNVLN